MAIPMARPWKHPVTGVFYYHGRVPADLVDQLRGTNAAEYGAYQSAQISRNLAKSVTLMEKGGA